MRIVIITLLALASAACMRVPAGLHMVVTDEPQAVCHAYANCYDDATRSIVVVPGQPLKVVAHEACHAHQAQEVRDELGVDPSIDLHEWYDTEEYRSYVSSNFAPRPSDWRLSADTILEEFAEACGRYLAGGTAYQSEPSRDAWFRERGF